MQRLLKVLGGILLICGLALLLASPTLAQIAQRVTWEDLRSPTSLQLEDPYQHLSQQQLYDLAELVRLRETDPHEKGSEPQTTKARQRLEHRLRHQGLDVEQLLSQVDRARQYHTQKAQATNSRLEGHLIRLQGYLLPLDARFGDPASEFLLVPYVGACIHVPQPPPNQIVYVTLSDTIEAPRTFTRVMATGILERRLATYELFLMDGTQPVDVNYALTQATIALNPPSLANSSIQLDQAGWQAKVSRYLTQMLNQMRDRPSPQLLGFGLLMAFSYGVLHTLGPGHGKTVIVSYFIGEGGSLRRGILMGVRIAIFHVLSAVIGVLLLDAILQQTLQDSAIHYRIVRVMSYSAIAFIGASMLQRSLRRVLIKPAPAPKKSASAHLLYPTLASSLALNTQAFDDNPFGPIHPDYQQAPPSPTTRPIAQSILRPTANTGNLCNCLSCWQPRRRQSPQTHKWTSWLAMAIGAVPCSGAILILLFGLANNFLWPSILMVIAISLGMAVTLSGIGVIAIFGRTLIDRRFVHKRQQPSQLIPLLQVLASGSILMVGMSLLGYTLVA